MIRLKGVDVARVVLLGLMLPARDAGAGIGDVDSSFGDGGHYKMPFDSGQWHDLIALPDGRLLSASALNGGAIQVFRSDANGHPDESFGVGGARLLPSTEGRSVAAMAPSTGGAAYLATMSSIARLTAVGEIDQAFGQGGWVEFPVAAVAGARGVMIDAIAPLADGGVAVLAVYYQQFYDDCAIAQHVYVLQPDGSVATGSPAGGINIVLPTASPYSCYEMRSGRLRQMGGGLLRYEAGWNRQMFDLSGKQQAAYSGLPGDDPYLYESNFLAVAVPDTTRQFDFVMRESPKRNGVEVVRLLPDRTVDYSFAMASGGRAIVDLVSKDPDWSGSTVTTDGFLEAGGRAGQFIYVVLNVLQDSQRRFPRIAVVVVRLHQDGTIDQTFGEGGQIWIPGAVTRSGILVEQQDGSALLQLGMWGGNTVVRLSGGSAPCQGVIKLSGESGGMGYRSVVEGTSATVWATRSAGSQGAVTLPYRVVPSGATAGEDYQDVSGTLNWADGETGTKRVDVKVLVDAKGESRETFEIRFESPAGATLLPDSQWQFSIQEGAAVQPVSVLPPGPSAASSSGESKARGGGALGYPDAGGLALLLSLLLSRGSPRAGICLSRRSCRSRST